jgi:hypothetical protein
MPAIRQIIPHGLPVGVRGLLVHGCACRGRDKYNQRDDDGKQAIHLIFSGFH